MNRPEYYLWYRPLDKRYYMECKDEYDGFAISAHMLTHFANSFSVFQSSMNKPYFIDPETAAFQNVDISRFLNSKGGVRISWKKLGKHYGSVVMGALENRVRLRTTDFLNHDNSFKPNVQELTARVLSFQTSLIKKTVSGLSLFFKKKPQEKMGLQFVVAPYFFFDSLSDPWYRISLEMARRAVKLKGEYPVFATLCTTRQFLAKDENIKTVVKDFDFNGLDGFLIWIDNMKEEDEETALFGNILKLVKYLSSNTRKVINLYGGYFSILAFFWGMSAHVSGVCYRDSRSFSELPIYGGPPGGPVPRYYIPRFRTKVPLDDAIRLLQQFPELKCDCDICSGNVTAYAPDTERSFARFIMNKHFLCCRKREREETIDANSNKLFEALNGEFTRYKKFEEILPISHLARWYSAIQDNASLYKHKSQA